MGSKKKIRIFFCFKIANLHGHGRQRKREREREKERKRERHKKLTNGVIIEGKEEGFYYILFSFQFGF